MLFELNYLSVVFYQVGVIHVMKGCEVLQQVSFKFLILPGKRNKG